MSAVPPRARETASAVDNASSPNTFTLSGAVTGFQSFNTAVGTGIPVQYYAVDGSGNWEEGIGVLSTSTNLQRTTKTSTSGTMTASSLEVYAFRIAAGAANGAWDYIRTASAMPGVTALPSFSHYPQATQAFTVDRLYYQPCRLMLKGAVTTWRVRVATSPASTATLYYGFYTVATDGDPGVLIAESSASVSTGIDGNVISGTISGMPNYAGDMFFAAVCDVAWTPYVFPSEYTHSAWLGMNASRIPVHYLYQTHTAGALPTPGTLTEGGPTTEAPINSFVFSDE